MYVLEFVCAILSVLSIVMLFVFVGIMIGTGVTSKATLIASLVGFPIWLLQLATFTILNIMKG